MDCSSTNVIYLATCTKCSLQYVGSTTTSFKIRFRNHKLFRKTKKKACEVVIHFNAIPHQISNFQLICIEKVVDENNLESKLITRETYWIAQLRTLRLCGLNKRQKFKPKNRTITMQVSLSSQVQTFYLFVPISIFYVFNIPNKNNCK